MVKVKHLWPVGGGARNRTLVRMIQREPQPVRVALIDEFGIRAEANEAVSFAILAHETIRGAPSNPAGLNSGPTAAIMQPTHNTSCPLPDNAERQIQAHDGEREPPQPGD